MCLFFFSSRRRHTRLQGDWSSDVCSSDLDVIVNAAAHTAVDKAESEPDQARLLNALAPQVLAREAAQIGALLVHYSTDYVFDGSGSAARTETEATRSEERRVGKECRSRWSPYH